MSAIKKSPSSPLIHLLGTTGAADGLFGSVFSHFTPNHAARRRSWASAAFVVVFFTLFFVYSSTLYHYRCPRIPSNNLVFRRDIVVEEEEAFSSSSSSFVDSFPVLLPGWEVLLITERRNFTGDRFFFCLYPNNETSPATMSSDLPLTNQSTFKCELPKNNRRKIPFLSPALVAGSSGGYFLPPPPPREIVWWNYLAYESVSTQDDVVLFAKGVNNHQGINTSPHELRCVFFFENGTNVARTRVHVSNQEVFRCSHPGALANPSTGVKVSLEMLRTKKVIPSVAYYNQRIIQPTEEKREKATVCAMTMVYNAGKFLREWVIYHASVGVEKFIFYDNDGNDDTVRILQEMREEGFDVERETWKWPKAQEAGFSHAALLGNATCTWMMYLDVDEFLYSPSWINFTAPSKEMIPGIIKGREKVGQVSFKCDDFGPSGQRAHPEEGVIQGYTCRRKLDTRHKSMVRLTAVDGSLSNAVHHFIIDQRTHTWWHLGLDTWLVNHYKFQAWEEFKGKFRRRVSAYVVDWTKNVNMNSQDRTPGLGANAVEPRGWEEMFCEVKDERLKMITQAWFWSMDAHGRFRMVWEKPIKAHV